MKKLILLLIIISSCTDKIDKKDLQGNWSWHYQENDNNNLDQIIIIKDSITLIDFFDYSKKGIYSLKKDSIIINLKNEIIKRKISLNDTSLVLNSSNFQKSEYINNEKYEEIQLINISSKLKKNANEFYEYQGNFILLKHNDSIKIKLNNKYVKLSEYVYSIRLHNERWGHIVFLGENLSLRELKNIFLEMIYNNIHNIKFITKANFQDYNYDFHQVRVDLWGKEVNQYILENRLEKKQFPNMPESYSKKDYIKIKNPNLIEIKSKNDFAKLEETKANSTYLISINIDLSVEEYLLLNQKINKVRKENKLKIRTEIISF